MIGQLREDVGKPSRRIGVVELGGLDQGIWRCGSGHKDPREARPPSSDPATSEIRRASNQTELLKAIADSGNRPTPAVARHSVIRSSKNNCPAADPLSNNQKTPISRCSSNLLIGTPSSEETTQICSKTINRKLPVMPAHLSSAGQSSGRPSPRTAWSLSDSPFRQRDTAGDSDRKPKHGCAYCQGDQRVDLAHRTPSTRLRLRQPATTSGARVQALTTRLCGQAQA